MLALSHELGVLQRSVKRLTATDRFLWAGLSQRGSGWLSALVGSPDGGMDRASTSRCRLVDTAPHYLLRDPERIFRAAVRSRFGILDLTSDFGTVVTLTACLRGTGNREHSPRMPGSCDGHERCVASLNPSFVRTLLSSLPDRLVIRQGRARNSTGPGCCHRQKRCRPAGGGLHHRYERQAA
jgi:hypothetical protein